MKRVIFHKTMVLDFKRDLTNEVWNVCISPKSTKNKNEKEAKKKPIDSSYSRDCPLVIVPLQILAHRTHYKTKRLSNRILAAKWNSLANKDNVSRPNGVTVKTISVHSKKYEKETSSNWHTNRDYATDKSKHSHSEAAVIRKREIFSERRRQNSWVNTRWSNKKKKKNQRHFR